MQSLEKLNEDYFGKRFSVCGEPVDLLVLDTGILFHSDNDLVYLKLPLPSTSYNLFV